MPATFLSFFQKPELKSNRMSKKGKGNKPVATNEHKKQKRGANTDIGTAFDMCDLENELEEHEQNTPTTPTKEQSDKAKPTLSTKMSEESWSKESEGMETKCDEKKTSKELDLTEQNKKDMTNETEIVVWERDRVKVSIWKQEMDLRCVKTKSGNHIFEPVFYHQESPNGTGYVLLRQYIYEKTLAATLQLPRNATQKKKCKKKKKKKRVNTCVVADQLNNQKVAVKVANKLYMEKKQSMTGTLIAEDFINEITILKKISRNKVQHPGLFLCAHIHTRFAKLINEWETVDHKYMAMEYCAGGDLFEYTQRVLHKCSSLQPRLPPPSSPSKACEPQLMKNNAVYGRFLLIQHLFAQMVSAVAYLHNMVEVCHMDISLENFMIVHETLQTTMPTLKLIDFGLAKDCSAKTQNMNSADKGKDKDKDKDKHESNARFLYNECVGKLKYQSPECYDCRHKEFQRYYDCRLNDTYCLGVCLFMLLFAQHPYERPSSRNDTHCIQLLRHGLMPFIQHRHYHHLVNVETVHLLDHLLTFPQNRFYINQICNHPFFTSCTMASSSH
ncbi:Protein kinase domain containing protein [Reticulomyxa filosa]|uniref:Protein kinase domain containing protein n=1 Tax=Reticulomyxa filosa TaxID=46433 RepID=X6NY65_RETFI|nr:Protein kinase domain containing protein [Reticulomyxa filosa]|eukprot:ETO30237.1 Protein kinase domain containing protein [Reticulomyxa filosa]